MSGAAIILPPKAEFKEGHLLYGTLYNRALSFFPYVWMGLMFANREQCLKNI